MSILRPRLLMATALALIVAQPLLAADLKIGMKSEPSSMDPQFHVLAPNMQVSLSIFESLTMQDAKGAVKPMLAESWTLASPTEWDFKLRSGVTFSDGTLLTADDVVFTFDRVAKVPNSPSPFTLFTRKIASVTALDGGHGAYHHDRALSAFAGRYREPADHVACCSLRRRGRGQDDDRI